MRRERAQRWGPPGVIALAVLIFLWPLALRPTGIPFTPGSGFTDLLISHLPNAAYLRDTLWAEGQVPLWNTQLFLGQPFAADPLAGLWYPPNWLLLIVPLAFGFNLLLALHLIWGGLGVYRLARAEGVSQGGALLGGVFFAGTPKLIAHLGAGHVSLIYAVAWTPWLLLAARNLTQTGGWRRGAIAGATLAVSFLADVRWAYYAGALAATYGLAEALKQRPARRPFVVALVASAALVLLISAPLALPLAEFIAHSRRAALTVAEAGAYSLPPVYLLGLVIPDLGGFHEYMTYLGVVTLLLALAGLGRRTLFWALAIAVAVLFALGTNFFVYPLLFTFVPGVSLLRVPPRAWFIVALAACVLAGHGTDKLLNYWLPSLRRRPGALVPLPNARTALVGLLVLGGLDLLRVDSTLLEARPLPAVNAAAAWIKQQPGVFRVYSPSYSLPPGDGLAHLDGIDPLQLEATAALIATATNIPGEGYSVTVPPFATADLAHEHAGVSPNTGLLGRLNVGYLASEYALDASGLMLIQTVGTTSIYQNDAWRGRAYFESGEGSVSLDDWTPNHLLLTADGGGQLVIAEAAYPGWRIIVDGAVVPAETTDDGLLAVTLPAGRHQVYVEFQPVLVYTGIVAAGVGVALLALAELRARQGAKA